MSDLVGAVRALDPTVRKLADSIEAGRRVPAHLAGDIGRTGMWLSCVPKAVGGLQTPLVEVLEAIEVLGRADGSTGWVAMICATTGLIRQCAGTRRSMVAVAVVGMAPAALGPPARRDSTDIDGPVPIRRCSPAPVMVWLAKPQLTVYWI